MEVRGLAPEADDPALAVQQAVFALAGGPQLAGVGVPHLVAELEADAVVIGQLDGDGYGVVEVSHGLVLGGDADHRHHDAPGLHLPEGDAHLGHPVHAGLLEPADVVAVVDDGHLVGLVVFRVVNVRFDFHGDTSLLWGVISWIF